MYQGAFVLRLSRCSKESQVHICECHAGGVSDVGDVVLGYAADKSPFICWCPTGGTVSRHGKGLKSLDGVQDDDAAEQVAIVGCSGWGLVGSVSEFAHPKMLWMACLATDVNDPVSFLAQSALKEAPDDICASGR